MATVTPEKIKALRNLFTLVLAGTQNEQEQEQFSAGYQALVTRLNSEKWEGKHNAVVKKIIQKLIDNLHLVPTFDQHYVKNTLILAVREKDRKRQILAARPSLLQPMH